MKEYWSEQIQSPESPTSSSSSSSTETIRPSSSKGKYSEILSETKTIEQIVDNDWKTLINSNIKESIEYVETHFPKSELEDTTYIEKLIKDVKNENINYAQDIRSKIHHLTRSELKYANALVNKTDLWIDSVEEKLKNLD